MGVHQTYCGGRLAIQTSNNYRRADKSLPPLKRKRMGKDTLMKLKNIHTSFILKDAQFSIKSPHTIHFRQGCINF